MLQRQIEHHMCFHRLPKVALHRHFEGSLRLETLMEVKENVGLDVQVDTIDQLRGMVTMANRRGTSQTYLSNFKILRQFFRSQELIQRYAREVVADAAADNIRYLELRFTPRALAQVSGFDFSEVTDWVCDAVAEACAEHGIITRLILSMNRNESLEIGEGIAQTAVDHKDKGVVGLDLAGGEDTHPTQPFGSIFVRAKQEGLGITVHAGEWSGPESVRYAIENLVADRIGHGVRVIENSDIARLARERGMVFEVCPSSNIQSGIAPDLWHHPLRDMFFLSLRTTLNTDNTCVSAVTLSEEMYRVHTEMGFGLAELKQMTMNAARAAFIPEAERALLVTEFETALTEFEDESLEFTPERVI